MITVAIVSYSLKWGLVLYKHTVEFFTYKEAKDEVDRLYKESSYESSGGLVVAAFILSETNGKTELVYSSVNENAVNHGFTCPVCKNKVRVIRGEYGPVRNKWFMFCDTCASRTGFYDTEDEAIEAWYKLTGGRL